MSVMNATILDLQLKLAEKDKLLDKFYSKQQFATVTQLQQVMILRF
jgi:hypothetical protein